MLSSENPSNLLYVSASEGLVPTKGTILLVEDNAQDVELIRLAFRTLNCPYNLAAVSDGRAAIHYLSRIGQYSDRTRFPDPCLMLLDLSLPQVGGFEVLAWMQGEPPEIMPPVLVLSYSRFEQDKHLAHKFGAKGYHVKSPDLNETIALIRSLLTFNWLPRI